VARVSVERRLPVVYSDIESVELGGLVSYGSSLIADVRQAADLLARVLKGEKPADIPIEQAARFELAVNLKTARAIGIEIPRLILLRADRVIE
jgi:putative ABC transport system substrate-binding protein